MGYRRFARGVLALGLAGLIIVVQADVPDLVVGIFGGMIGFGFVGGWD